MQAGIPGVLLAPERQPGGQAHRRRDPRRRPSHLQFVYPARDGYVSITLLFGDDDRPVHPAADGVGARGGPLRRGDAATGTGTRSACGWRPRRRAPSELEQVKAAITGADESQDQGRAVRRGPAAAACCSPRWPPPAELVADAHLAERDYWETVDGRALPRPVRQGSRLGRCPASSARRRRSASAARPRGAPRPTPHAPSRPVDDGGAAPRRAEGRRPDVGVRRPADDPGAGRLRRDRRQGREAPTHPDASRSGGGALRGDLGIEGSIAFAHFNCGKLSLTPRPRPPRPAGRCCVDLVRWADVLIESYTPGRDGGAGARLRRRCAQVNPGLIMMSTSLMGQTGPLVDVRRLRQPGRRHHRLLRADRLAGPLAGRAVPRLHRLRRAPLRAWPRCSPPSTGAGAPAAASTSTSSQAEASIHFLAPAMLDHTVNGSHPTRQGNADPCLAPHGVYRCAGDDAWVAIACETDEQRARWRPISVGSPTTASRRGPRPAPSPRSSGRCRPLGVPVHGVQNSAACWADPQLRHRGHYVTVPHPVHEHVHHRGPARRLSRTPGARAPRRTRRWASTTTSCCASCSATTRTRSPNWSSPARSGECAPGAPNVRATTDVGHPDPARRTTYGQPPAPLPAGRSGSS